MKTFTQAKTDLAALVAAKVSNPEERRAISSAVASYVAAAVREDRRKRQMRSSSGQIFADSLFGRVFGERMLGR